MELDGMVYNGVIVLEPETVLPEGTRVKVTTTDAVATLPTHFDLFRDVIGKAQGLPEDMALNHNNYIRGGPRK